MASQYCPICKTRLWIDPLLSPSRLRCPRCGTEFKPTVPWHYVRILFAVVLALTVLVLILFTRGNWLWVLFFFIGGGSVAGLWYLSRLIDLKQIGPALTPEEGVLDSKQLELELEEDDLEAKHGEAKEKERFRIWVLILAAVGLTMIVLVIRWVLT